MAALFLLPEIQRKGTQKMLNDFIADIPGNKYRLAVFDLDGTVLDTIHDFADSINYGLSVAGFPARSEDEIKLFTGNGLRKAVERSCPPNTSVEQQNIVMDAWAEHYKLHGTDFTRPFEGITELLKDLRRNGIKTAVVSNKKDFAVQSLCRHFFPDLFDIVMGERPGIRRKPAPDAIYEVLEKWRVSREQAVYIGDSEVDYETAKNADMKCILVEWGYRGKNMIQQFEDAQIVSTTAEIKTLFGI